jgi:acetoin utilization protein AcuC
VFFYHERMKEYDFGPQHPLRPERLDLFLAVLGRLAPDVAATDPGLAPVEDVLRVHDAGFVEAVRAASEGRATRDLLSAAVLGPGDTPAFPGIFEAALAYCGGAVRAAEAVRDGQAIAFNMAGGLHHARRSEASGFCTFNDPAIAASVLRERFDRVAYVDIDVHHGDGVQWIFFEDPTVMTCSIHQTGRTLYPGTGFVSETGAEGTSVNVPLEPFATGDTWLWAFRNGILPALERFGPQALVLQMGADAHFMDPLAHLQVAAQEWWQAVDELAALGLPTVAMGGGGYSMDSTPRLWAGAVVTLLGRPELRSGLDDERVPQPRRQGESEAERTVAELSSLLDRARATR